MRPETHGIEGLDGGHFVAVTESGKILMRVHS